MNNILTMGKDLGGIAGPSFVRNGSSNDNFEIMNNNNNKNSSGSLSFVSDKQNAM